METAKPALDETEALRIVEECYADVLAYCRRHAKSREEAEEIVQEAFLRFVANPPREGAPKKPIAYLIAIARNLCIDATRRRGVMTFVPISEAAEPGANDTYPSEMQSMLEALDDREREAIELRYDQGLGIGDIAAVMGVSRFTVNRLLKKALARLRREIDDREREAIELRYDQGLGIGDIAAVMGVSRFTVNRLLKKALARLRREIASGDDERQHR